MHIPSSMNQTFSAGISVVNIAVAPDLNAGGSIIQTITDSNRDRLNSVGSRVDSINFNITTRDHVDSGIIEFVVAKLERQHDVPTATVEPLPTNADILSTGLQQAMRLNNPGRVLKFGTFAYTPELAMSRNISVNFAKYKLSSVRSGDYFLIILYNRTDTNPITLDVQMRYKELKS